jgi:hypothetical protein
MSLVTHIDRWSCKDCWIEMIWIVDFSGMLKLGWNVCLYA